MLFFILSTFCLNVFSQSKSLSISSGSDDAHYGDSLKGFDMEELMHHLVKFNGTEKEKQQHIARVKRAYVDRKYKIGVYGPPKINARNSGNPNSPDAISCTNIGFESGNTSGWTVTGDNAVTNGAALDPFGNFPKVFAGNYSLQLSSNNTGTSNFQSSASRVIAVTGTNAFFKLNFALDILDYPHTQAAAAKFTVNFFDASNNELPCPQYECYYYQNSANVGTAVGISSFQQTPGSPGVNIGGQAFPVTYAPWQTITMDLSAYAGQNVTCKIECDWCIYNYDWAYCYIDADCPVSNVSPVASCGTLPFTLSGPTGMDTYSWTPPPGNSPTTSNTPTINASVAGTYTLHCTLNTCSVSAYTYTYNVQPGPTPNFLSTAIPCSGNLTFTNTSTVNGGPPITGYTWEWGDGTPNGTTANAAHTFTATGTNTVTLVITNGTCIDSISKTVVIPTHPVAAFNVANNCLNAVSNYTSTSTASAGIATQAWNFGDNTTGTGVNTSHTYASAGTYSITLVVTDNNSCKDSVTKPITIYPLPPVAVNSSTICIGQQTATLTATGATTYTWNPTTGLTPTTGSPVTGTPAATTDYTVTGTDANGCTNTATATITVNPLPVITVNSSTICIGQQTATLTATGASTYNWNPTTGLTPTTGSPVTGTPVTTTDYTVTGTDANGCISSATATITVNPLPVITVNSSTICAGQQTATLTATGASTYVWNPITGLTPSSGSPVAGNPAATTDYTLTGTDANGCVSSATATITVNPLPVITVNSSTICAGQQTATLTAAGASTYIWNPTTGLTPTTGSPVTGTPAATTDYTVTGTDANGCVSSATATITVNPLPVITVNSSTICIGQQTATLTATGASTYIWNPTTGLTPASGSPVTGTPAATTDYTVTGTDANGCVSSATATITVNPLPVITVNSSTICAGQQTATLTAAGASTYAWNPTTGLTPTSGSPVTGTPATTTDYTVTGTDANGCVSNATATITVNPLPPVTVNTSTICIGQQTATLTASGATTYSWNPSGTLNNSTGTPVIGTTTVTTNYTVTGTDANGCVNAATTSITVNPLPPVAVNTATICAGQQTATLTATGAATYAWNPTTGLNPASGSPVMGTPGVTTIYTVTGTDAAGCVNTATTSITVNPLPLPTATSNTPCVGQQPINLSCPLNNMISYAWSGPNAYTSNAQNPVIPLSGVIPAAGGVYTVLVTDNNGCTNTANIHVTINPLPVVTVNSPTVCMNQTINLTATGGVIYSWAGPAAYTSSLPNPSIPDASLAAGGSYTVLVQDANGCLNAMLAQVVVNPLPVITANTDTICLGQQTATLTANGAITYTWSPSNTLSGNTGTSVTGTPNATTLYTITATDNKGCVNDTTTVIFVRSLPIVTTASVTPACVPLCTTIPGTSNPPANNYVWNFGNGQAPASTNLNTPSNSFLTSACYTVSGTFPITLTVTDINGCVNTASTSVTTYPLPIADFDYGPQPVSIIEPKVQFVNQSAGAISAYNWNFGDPYNSNDTSDVEAPLYTYLNVGTYSVTLEVTTAYGCTSTVVKPLVVNEIYVIYVPNAFTPNGDGTNDIFKAVGEGINTFELYIFDRWGNMLFYSDDINKGWDGTFQGRSSTEILQEDVYVWKINLTDFSNASHSLHGTVSLIK